MRSLNGAGSINIDNNNPTDYPNGRIKNNTGTGNGTPVNEFVYGDLHQAKEKMLRLYGITANGLPDNETNGFQLVDGFRALASKNDFILPISLDTGVLSVPIKLGFMLENEQIVCKTSFNLATQTQIKGIDNTTFSFTKNGDFKTDDYVRLIKTGSGIQLVVLADYIPNLATRLNNIETEFTTIQNKLAVFTLGGVMFIWRKAGAIPTGFQEVTDYRGKTVFGMDVTQTEFAIMGATANRGSKHAVLIDHDHDSGSYNVGNPPILFNAKGLPAGSDVVYAKTKKAGSSTGEDGVGKNLPPYGVERFIEWATI